jgi:hypothetical protein
LEETRKLVELWGSLLSKKNIKDFLAAKHLDAFEQLPRAFAITPYPTQVVILEKAIEGIEKTGHEFKLAAEDFNIFFHFYHGILFLTLANWAALAPEIVKKLESLNIWGDKIQFYRKSPYWQCDLHDHIAELPHMESILENLVAYGQVEEKEEPILLAVKNKTTKRVTRVAEQITSRIAGPVAGN